MIINLKTGGLFTKLLPAGTTGNKAQLDVPDGMTPTGVVGHMGGDPDGRFLLVLNDKVVPPSERHSVILKDGDHLSLMPPIKGG
jgi:thiamine biosynthesis protein ThiS